MSSDSDSEYSDGGGASAATAVWPHADDVRLSMDADKLINIVDDESDGEVPSDVQKLIDCLDCAASAHQWLSTWDSQQSCSDLRSLHEEYMKEIRTSKARPEPKGHVSEHEDEVLKELCNSILHQTCSIRSSASRSNYITTPDIMSMFYAIIPGVYKAHQQFSGRGATYAVSRPLQDHPPFDQYKYRMADIVVLPKDIAQAKLADHLSTVKSLREAREDDSNTAEGNEEDQSVAPPLTEPAKTTAATVSAVETAEIDGPEDLVDHELHLLHFDVDKPQAPAALCVAQLTHLPGLLTSAVYHSHYSGTCSPIIGFGYSRLKSNVRLVIAWLDDRKDDEVGLRGIRLAPLSTKAFPDATFDLCDPAEAIRLTLFLLRAQNVLARPRVAPAYAAPWRADTWVPSHSVPSSKGNIARWVEDVQKCPVSSAVAEEFTNLEVESEVSSVA
ncbi:hypothetical protein BD626DRAFT_505213 [Schizophyllum amplum]|uniref:Uncharacterized protein n=1 Tax=Schizophyllum amplum TaxID=97359 RepID=A0A550C6G4_9AGAR|nr:hypothetical protein BD626DRAFT_505213 [Auriculariopsis ampla]